jgi:tRNA pseudouridine55 synthase
LSAPPTHDGLLLVDKPAGCTSHDVVQRARRIFGQKRIGHCGTLDPGATGLLVLTLGRATRLTRFLIQAPKIYEGDIQFGMATDTYDALGKVTEEHSIDGLTAEMVADAMPSFVGTYEQAAPAYSAKKVDGRKYYELARKGEEVPENRKEITVYSFDMDGPFEEGRLRFRLECTSGTYVRTVAQELGQVTGFGAHLASLRRTKVGTFLVSDAIGIEPLADKENPIDGAWWVAFHAIPLPFAELVIEPRQARRLIHGQTVLVRDLEGEEGDWIKLLDTRRRFIAVGTISERIGADVGIVQPRIVFS